ncbi:MAG: VanW family protein [Clostridia bacterium]|nr:VanW family protein [Clostridia bacterium]
MSRKLFCEISPLTYKISVLKCRTLRHLKNAFSKHPFATVKSEDKLPVAVYKHKSLIRRTLGNVQPQLQENKAVNLALTAPKINGVLIRPGEVFSFWKLAGNLSANKGYKEGLIISGEKTASGVGGGICQFTNLIHWMVLHSPLDIVEHHHHDGYDLFPDFNRQVPFGTGTSVAYNHVDYRFKNNTNNTYQLISYVTDTHLCGELLTDAELSVKYHIESENEHFIRENGQVYRKGQVYRSCIDKKTGNLLSKELLRDNHAKVLYDTSNLNIIEK